MSSEAAAGAATKQQQDDLPEPTLEDLAQLRNDMKRETDRISEHITEIQKTMMDRITALKNIFEEHAPLSRYDGFFALPITFERYVTALTFNNPTIARRLGAHGGVNPVVLDTTALQTLETPMPRIPLSALVDNERIKAVQSVTYAGYQYGRPKVVVDFPLPPAPLQGPPGIYLLEFKRGILGVASTQLQLQPGTHVVCDSIEPEEPGCDIAAVIAKTNAIEMSEIVPGSYFSAHLMHPTRIEIHREAEEEEVEDWMGLSHTEELVVEIVNATFLQRGVCTIAIDAHCRWDRRFVTLFILSQTPLHQAPGLAEHFAALFKAKVAIVATGNETPSFLVPRDM